MGGGSGCDMRTCVLAGSCIQVDVSDEGGNNAGYASVFLGDELIGQLTDFSSTDTISVDCYSLS